MIILGLSSWEQTSGLILQHWFQTYTFIFYGNCQRVLPKWIARLHSQPQCLRVSDAPDAGSSFTCSIDRSLHFNSTYGCAVLFYNVLTWISQDWWGWNSAHILVGHLSIFFWIQPFAPFNSFPMCFWIICLFLIDMSEVYIFSMGLLSLKSSTVILSHTVCSILT